jgi:hypothetical protein
LAGALGVPPGLPTISPFCEELVLSEVEGGIKGVFINP